MSVRASLTRHLDELQVLAQEQKIREQKGYASWLKVSCCFIKAVFQSFTPLRTKLCLELAH